MVTLGAMAQAPKTAPAPKAPPAETKRTTRRTAKTGPQDVPPELLAAMTEAGGGQKPPTYAQVMGALQREREVRSECEAQIGKLYGECVELRKIIAALQAEPSEPG